MRTSPAIFERQARGAGRLALIMLDLDGLKAVNDARGHQAGDERLQTLAGALSESFRGGDCAYRVGGDEFAVILPASSPWDALEATQRLQAALGPHGVGVTAGIADGTTSTEVDSLIREADLALIAGKRRHQAVTLYSPELQPATETPDADREAEHISSLSTALALAVDAKDSYTRSHCQTVSELCVLIATELALAAGAHRPDASRGTASRRRQDRHPRRDPHQTRRADRRGIRADETPLGPRRGDRRRRRPRHRGAVGPPPPRAL